MNKLMHSIVAIIMLVSVSAAMSLPGKKQTTLDLRQPADNLRAFIKTRASLDEKDTVIYWNGTIYSFVPGEKSRVLLGFEGYNIARAVAVPGGYRLLTREVSFYLDPESGQLLERWKNPINGRTVDVVHVWNDPVNQELLLEGKQGPLRLPVTTFGNQRIWSMEVLLSYPSPLPRSLYPRYSQSDVYHAAELFQFITTEESLNAASSSADCLISWTRVCPWLPWMEMGDSPGQLVYHCSGMKVDGGFSGLSEQIRSRVITEAPHYATAPAEFTSPNETSWTYFLKKLLATERKDAND